MPTFAKVIAFLLILSITSPCIAQIRHQITISDIGVFESLYPRTVSLSPNVPSIEVKFDNYPPQGHYRFHVRLSPTGANTFASDGILELKLLARSFDGQNSRKEFSMSIPVVSGETVSESSVLIPQSQGQGNLTISPYWNGRPFAEGQVGLDLTRWNQSTAQSLFVFSADTLSRRQDSSQLAANDYLLSKDRWLFNNGYIGPGAADFLHGRAELMPVDWRELSTFSSIEIFAEDLAKLTLQQIQTLEKYILVGGELRIVSSKDSGDSAIEQWVQAVVSKEWSWILSQKNKDVIEPKQAIDQQSKPSELNSILKAHQFGLGSVIFTSDRLSTSVTTNGPPIDSLFFDVSQEYWDWLIPNVGKTPIYLFLVLATGFVCIVAPAIMVWSSRHNRRIWALILMPIAGTLATLSLLLSAWLGGGNTSYERIRSLTIIDDLGFGVTWARQTAFSTSPRSIQVDNDTLLSFLLWHDDVHEFHLQSVITENSAEYRRAIPARSTFQVQQVSTVQTQPLLKAVELQDGSLSVTNQSDSDIRGGVLTNSAHQLFLLPSINSGQTLSLSVSTTGEVDNHLSLLNAKEPLVRPSSVPGRLYNYYGNAFQVPSRQLRGEELWEDWFGGAPILSNSTKHEIQNLAPKKYLVFSESNETLRHLLPEVTETNSIHVFLGSW